MTKKLVLYSLLILIMDAELILGHQNAPPMVNPHQYNPAQQPPVAGQASNFQHNPSGYQAGHDQNVLHGTNLHDEAGHISEHMDVPLDTTKMTEQELQFHYFKMHDTDNNNKLDGSELIKSVIHWHGHDSLDDNQRPPPKVFTDLELIQLIDPILKMDDLNVDGYIDYIEFIKAQQKAGV